MSYKYLIFKPACTSLQIASNEILWKAQVIVPANYVSIASTLLEDNISINNRRKLSDWENLLEENGFKYEKNFDHEYCKGYVIFDAKFTSYEFQLFACDVNAADYKVEAAMDLIHPLLYILELRKTGVIFPEALLKKIYEAKEKLTVSEDYENNMNKIVLNTLTVLEKLAQHCQDYEVDIFYSIMDA